MAVLQGSQAGDIWEVGGVVKASSLPIAIGTPKGEGQDLFTSF